MIILRILVAAILVLCGIACAGEARDKLYCRPGLRGRYDVVYAAWLYLLAGWLWVLGALVVGI